MGGWLLASSAGDGEARGDKTRNHRLRAIELYPHRAHGLRGEGHRLRSHGGTARRCGNPRTATRSARCLYCATAIWYCAIRQAIATYASTARSPDLQLIPSEPPLAGLTEQWVSFINTAIDPLLVRRYLLAYAAPKTADGRPDRLLIQALSARGACPAHAAGRCGRGEQSSRRRPALRLPTSICCRCCIISKLLPELGAMLTPSTALGRYHATMQHGQAMSAPFRRWARRDERLRCKCRRSAICPE